MEVNGGSLYVYNNGGNPLILSGDDGTNYVGMSYNSASNYGQIQSYTANVAGTLAINPSGGNVGIGTTDPGAPLEVKGTVTHATIAKFTDATDTTTCTLSAGGLIACSSDARLKKNIENISYGLDTVMGLRPVLYNWNSETDGTTKSLGFIAQEVEVLVPKLILTDDDNMKSLNSIGMVPILTKAIQEMNLNLDAIAGMATPIPTEASTSFTNTFFANLFTRMTTWLADSANNIASFVVQVIHSDKVYTKTLCIGDPGSETCLTQSQVDALLSNVNSSQNNSGPTCVSPQILVNNICVDPAPEPEPEPPTCVEPQTLVNNVCADPAP